MSAVRTRFAPSPTGFLHIGGARTALFNWLYAKKHGGEFILRIDDTDDSRNDIHALGPIFDGLKWLGIEWDKGPGMGEDADSYFQSQRRHLYERHLIYLLDNDFAYKDYSTEWERAQDRDEAGKAGIPYRFREKAYTAEQLSRFDVMGAPYCIRFRVPPGRELKIEDEIRGDVYVNTDEIADFVIARRDNSPLYSFATTVDDIDMGITHVIRSVEHLSNTFPQVLLYEALGYKDIPVFAHLPYVANPKSQKKMSKRDEGSHIKDYMGNYLPDAMRNYLVRLGWSLNGETEIITLDQMVENFSLERVVHAPASHDIDKLNWMQSEWMKPKSIDEKADFVNAYQRRREKPEYDREMLIKVLGLLGERFWNGDSFELYAGFFFHAARFSPDAVVKRLRNAVGKETVDYAIALVEGWEGDWRADRIEEKFVGWSGERGYKMVSVANALRTAVTGQMVGPSLYHSMELMGRTRVREMLTYSLDFFGA